MASTAALRADLPAVPTGPWRLRRGRMIVGDGSGGRDVDGGAPGAARAGPEGAGGGVRGGGGRGVVGGGRPAAERAGDAGPARGRRGRLAFAGGRPLARPAGRLAAVADRVRLVPALARAGPVRRPAARGGASPAAQGRAAAGADAGHRRHAGGE